MQTGVEAILTSFLGHLLPVPQLPVLAQGEQGQLVTQIHNVPKSTKPCSYPHLH